MNLKQTIKKYIPLFGFAALTGVLLMLVYIFVSRQVQNEYESRRREQIRLQIRHLNQSVANIILIRSRELQLISRSSEAVLELEKKLQIIPTDSFKQTVRIGGTGMLEQLYLPNVQYEGKSLWGDKEISKEIRKITNGHFNIYIKTENGYAQVLDNGRNTEELVPKIIHITDPAVQSIEKGITFTKRRVTPYDTRLTLYKPMHINGNLRGMIECSVDEGLSGYLTKTFQNTNESNEQLFLVQSDGTPILKTDAAKIFKDENLTKQLFKKRSNYSEHFYRYYSINNSPGVHIHYAYMPDSDIYAGLIIPSDSFLLLKKSINILVLSLLLVVYFIINAIFIYMALRYNRAYEGIVGAAFDLSVGQIADAKHKLPKNRGGEALAQIAEYLENITGFAHAIIADKNYEHYNPSPNDLPGQALLELKDDKDKLKERGLIKKFTSEIKKKTENGKNDINDLLQYASEIKPLALDVIKIIYKIIDIDQIGFFIVEKDGADEYLELQAAFAYNEERFFKGRISAKDSLTGRAVTEKESVFLKDIPDDYTKISGGFGDAKPGTISIIPLIFNNEVQAVIEIAAMKNIQSYQIKFLEEIGENIASTISNINNSKQTQTLLKQTEEQSKQIEIQRIELQEKIETHRRQNRRIDRELNEKRELLKSIQKAAFLIELNLLGEILDINKNMLELFGADINDWKGKKHKDFIVRDNYIEEYGGFFRALSRDKVMHKIETISLKGKLQMQFSVIYSPLRNARGRIKTVLLMAHKIDFES